MFVNVLLKCNYNQGNLIDVYFDTKHGILFYWSDENKQKYKCEENKQIIK